MEVFRIAVYSKTLQWCIRLLPALLWTLFENLVSKVIVGVTTTYLFVCIL